MACPLVLRRRLDHRNELRVLVRAGGYVCCRDDHAGSVLGRDRRHHRLSVVAGYEATFLALEQTRVRIGQVRVVGALLLQYAAKGIDHSVTQCLGARNLRRQFGRCSIPSGRVLCLQVRYGCFRTLQEPSQTLRVVGAVTGCVTGDSCPVHRLKGQVHQTGLHSRAHRAI